MLLYSFYSPKMVAVNGNSKQSNIYSNIKIVVLDRLTHTIINKQMEALFLFFLILIIINTLHSL